jgi:hypothetical protein
MTETRVLTDHEEIRDWAAARAGIPALQGSDPAVHNQSVLRLVFGQQAYLDTDMPDRPPATGGLELIDWDEWFKLFDERELALVVAEEVPGLRDEFHEIIRRDS